MNGDVIFWGKERQKYGNPSISEMISWMDYEGTNQIVLHYDHQRIKSPHLLNEEDNIGIKPKSSDIQKATNPVSVLDAYPLYQEKKGNCLIINNVNFKVAWLPERFGSDTDAENLTTLYSTLGFVVKQYDDLEGNQMKEKIQKFSKKMKPPILWMKPPTLRSSNELLMKPQMCIVILLSHGKNGAIYGTDGMEVSIEINE